MMKRFAFFAALLAVSLLCSRPLFADGANFDLEGPTLRVKITRGTQELGIGEVPSLLSGDKIWIQPAFPGGQAARYLLIVSFLRGSTNPPPEDWFTKGETWTKEVTNFGVTVAVPQGAEQAMVLLAPVTGGDFTTLRAAVRGKPGAFVRAVQDLQQASLQRSRLDNYLSAVQRIADNDPAALRKEAPLLAKSLKIKLDEGCFDRPADQQAECLTQNSSSLVLDDGSTQSMVSELTSGASSDLIGQISATRLAGGGAYSPYVGAVVDLVRIFGNLHTAKYQYIPAISTLDDERLGLKLNNPPSFRDPKSVIVVGLPPIGPSHPPVLLASEADKTHCLQDSNFVLPVDGAPLLFSTSYGRNLRLTTKDGSGKQIELPVVVDAERGGLVLKDNRKLPALLERKAKLDGVWGFDTFEGPDFRLLNASVPGNWKLLPEDEGRVLAGQMNTVHLVSPRSACSEKITLVSEPNKTLTWKPEKDGNLEVQLPLETQKPGEITLKVKQFGIEPETVTLRAYSNEIRLAGFIYHSGDNSLDVRGSHLEELASLKLAGIRFLPGGTSLSGTELTLLAQDDASTLKTAGSQTAKVVLRDGRTVDLNGQIEPPRPRVTLLDKQVAIVPAPGEREPMVSLRLGDSNDLPVNGTLTFFLKCEEKFNRAMKLEVATVDESASVILSFTDGGLVLQDATTARAELNPAKSFGPSIFGDLRFRVVDGKGVKGDWKPLTRLVRLPKISRIVCPDDVSKPCRLEGSDLFLIDSLSSGEKFTDPVVVSQGFAGAAITVPRPNGAMLYLKLRDAPETIDRLLAPVFPEQ